MSNPTITLNSEMFGHFHRTGRIEIHGNHSRFERTDVVISFIEGDSVSGDSATHIYLSPSEAKQLATAISEAVKMCSNQGGGK